MPAPIEHLGTRLDAIAALLAAQLPARHVKRSLRHYTDQDDAELLDGILTLVSAGERDYLNQRGMVAKEGTGKVLLIGHVKVSESDDPRDTEVAEIAFIEEVKAALRVGTPGIGFALERIEHSRQLEHPYGWFVAFVDAGPPLESIH